LLYARGGRYIDANFSKMDRIAWVEVTPQNAAGGGGAGGGGILNGGIPEFSGAGAAWWTFMCIALTILLAGFAVPCRFVIADLGRSLGVSWGGQTKKRAAEKERVVFDEKDEDGEMQMTALPRANRDGGGGGGGAAASKSLASQVDAPLPGEEEEGV
jgi:hypothetical protein